jgi:hypothetical protein
VSEGGVARRVIAAVTQDGLPRAVVTVARFRAPAPKVGPVRGVKVKRASRSRIVVTWSGAANAVRYYVSVRRSGGRDTYAPLGRARRVVARGVARNASATVSVVGVSPSGRRGRLATVRVRPVRR